MIIHPFGKKPRTVYCVPKAERQKRISEGLKLKLCQELDEELDGVRMPASAAAICTPSRT